MPIGNLKDFIKIVEEFCGKDSLYKPYVISSNADTLGKYSQKPGLETSTPDLQNH